MFTAEEFFAEGTRALYEPAPQYMIDKMREPFLKLLAADYLFHTYPVEQIAGVARDKLFARQGFRKIANIDLTGVHDIAAVYFQQLNPDPPPSLLKPRPWIQAVGGPIFRQGVGPLLAVGLTGAHFTIADRAVFITRYGLETDFVSINDVLTVGARIYPNMMTGHEIGVDLAGSIRSIKNKNADALQLGVHYAFHFPLRLFGHTFEVGPTLGMRGPATDTNGWAFQFGWDFLGP